MPTTFITAIKPESGSEDLVQVPIFTMQNPTHNSPLSTNFADLLLKCKRDTEEEMPGNDADPFPRASRTRDDPPKAHGPDSHFDIGSLKAKYGAIDKECCLHSDLMRKLNQFAICKMLEELKKKNLDELAIGSLEPYYAIIGDLEKLKIDMKWLVQRLDEIRDAIK